MGCQVEIAKQIKSQGGDFLFGLKGNQTKLREETEAVFAVGQAPKTHNVDEAIPPTIEQITQVDAGHGRLETRTVKVMSGFADWVPSQW